MIRTLFFAMVFLASPALADSSLKGYWTNPSGNVTVHIALCGPAVLCGRVVRASGDARASAAAAGTPRLIGAELMSDLKPVGDGVWHGSFFVPDRNVRADGDLRLLSSRLLKIEGCALGGLLCKSQRWTRIGTRTRTSATKR